ncbi:MAG: ribose-5-phosphate isomerase RpiA [Chitinophagaceae bacterium]
MLTKEETKKLAAVKALEYIRPGTTIGIGTGSTVYWFIQELARRVQQGFVCRAVPTSSDTNTLATRLGISMCALNDVTTIDVTIDGADEIDPQLNLIKGGGGALLQEKMVAAASDKLVIIADSSKYVTQLGAFALPVEVIPYGWKQVQQHIQSMYKISTALRMKNDQPLVTDHGHYILDSHFGQIPNALQLAQALNMIPGVVDNGLFIKMAREVIIADTAGNVKILRA